MKALAKNEADKRRRQVLAAATLADEQLCRGENEHSPSLALVVEQEGREAAERALALATAALAAALKRREAAERTSALAISMLANVQKRQQATERAQMSVQCRHSGDVAIERHSGDAAIERIRTEFALCAAPLDAILAEIACKETAFETAPSPHRPPSYVDAVLSTMGWDTQPSLPLALSPSALVPAALPLPDVDGQLQPVRQRARPRRCTGRRNCPRAPSPPDEGPPSHPHQMLDGRHTPTRWCHQLRPPRWHRLLPPSYLLLFLVTW